MVFVRRARRGAGGTPACVAGLSGAEPRHVHVHPSVSTSPGVLRDSDLVRAARGSLFQDSGLVHAPSRPLAARVPGRPRGHPHARVVHAARARHGDHSPAGASAWVDAAIFFSDIVVPLKAIRSTSTSSPASGRRGTPDPGAEDLEQLVDLTPDHVPYITEAVQQLVAELGSTPLIGFAGAPFTLASYLVEVGRQRTTSTPRP